MTKPYIQTREELTEMNRSQEMEILRLRAEVAQLGRRCSEQQRIIDTSQRYIARLKAGNSPRAKAEVAFKGATQ